MVLWSMWGNGDSYAVIGVKNSMMETLWIWWLDRDKLRRAVYSSGNEREF